MNICRQVHKFSVDMFSFARSEISGLYGNLNYLRDYQTVSHSGSTSLHSNQQLDSYFIFSISSATLVIIFLFDYNNLSGHFIVLLIYISMMANMLNIFSCAYWPSVTLLWRNGLFNSFARFLIGLLIFLLFLCKGSLYSLDINPLSDLQIFSPILCAILWLSCWYTLNQNSF